MSVLYRNMALLLGEEAAASFSATAASESAITAGLSVERPLSATAASESEITIGLTIEPITGACITQQYAEAALSWANPRITITQQAIEAALTWANPRIAITQQYVEVSYRPVVFSVNTVRFDKISDINTASAATIYEVNTIRSPQSF